MTTRLPVGLGAWLVATRVSLPGDLAVLKRYDITLRWTAPPLAFRLGPFRPWTAPGVYVDLHPAGGDWDLPVAVLNGQTPVAVASATWGAVKALYR